MSASSELAQYTLDSLRAVSGVRMRRFFGGYAFLSFGAQFAMLMDTLYFRVDETTRESYLKRGGKPFSYVSRGKVVVLSKYLSVPEGALDDEEELVELAREAIRVVGNQ